jgi:hypothetical protein
MLLGRLVPPVVCFDHLLQMADMAFESFLFLYREKPGGLFLKSFVFGTKGHQLPTLDFMGFFKGQGKYSLFTG